MLQRCVKISLRWFRFLQPGAATFDSSGSQCESVAAADVTHPASSLLCSTFVMARLTSTVATRSPSHSHCISFGSTAHTYRKSKAKQKHLGVRHDREAPRYRLSQMEAPAP